MEDSIEKYARESLSKELAYPYIAIAGEFYKKEIYRTAIAQLVLGLGELPTNQIAIGLLAACYAKLREYPQAEEVIELIELDKAKPEEIQLIKDQYKHLKEYIGSKRRK